MAQHVWFYTLEVLERGETQMQQVSEGLSDLVAPWPFFLPVSSHHCLLLPRASKVTERKAHHPFLKSQMKSPSKEVPVFVCEIKVRLPNFSETG
jgi:hypothetical protein